MIHYPWRIQLVLATLLSLLLWCYFLPVSLEWAWIGCVLTFIISGYIAWRIWQYKKQVCQITPYLNGLANHLDSLPRRLRQRLPVILVTGDLTAYFFKKAERISVTTQEIWISVPETNNLSLTIDELSTRWPDMAGKMGVLLALAPEKYSSKTELCAFLHKFRQSWSDANRSAGYTLPSYLAISAHLAAIEAENLTWYQITNQRLYLLDERRTPLEECCQLKKGNQSEAKVRLAIMLNELMYWVEQQILPVLSDSQQPVLPWKPLSIALLPVATNGVKNNVWLQHLRKLTTLTFQPAPTSTFTYPLPERLIEDMPVYRPLTIRTRATCHAIMLILLFLLLAICSSAVNNANLFRLVVADLKRYEQIPNHSNDDKITALNRLKEERQRLENYDRHGEPARYGFNLYRANQLMIPLDHAIKEYQPPVVPVKIPARTITAAKMVSLNSMSLFEVGKAELKQGSTKVLVDALVNIKAKPGWLILISGHSDSTGNPTKNQQLSSLRAIAVRDWMIATSDIPITCFAIQGFGSANPIADNDTAAGRTANRRVDISLVPEISACQPIQRH